MRGEGAALIGQLKEGVDFEQPGLGGLRVIGIAAETALDVDVEKAQALAVVGKEEFLDATAHERGGRFIGGRCGGLRKQMQEFAGGDLGKNG